MTTTAAKYEIPAPCCAPGDVTGDLNRQWACARTSAIYNAGQWADDIDATRKRMERARTEKIRRNLTNWITEQEERLARIIAQGWWTTRECSGTGNAVPCGAHWGQWS